MVDQHETWPCDKKDYVLDDQIGVGATATVFRVSERDYGIDGLIEGYGIQGKREY